MWAGCKLTYQGGMGKDIIPAVEAAASKIATLGVIGALVLTAAGMMLHSPVLGALALVVVLIAVVFRRPLARLFVRRP